MFSSRISRPMYDQRGGRCVKTRIVDSHRLMSERASRASLDQWEHNDRQMIKRCGRRGVDLGEGGNSLKDPSWRISTEIIVPRLKVRAAPFNFQQEIQISPRKGATPPRTWRSAPVLQKRPLRGGRTNWWRLCFGTSSPR